MKSLIRICLVLGMMILVLGAYAANGSQEPPVQETASILVLLGEWFGDSYFPLQKEIESRGWIMKRVGIESEYRGCYNKKRDIVLRSDILIQNVKDFSGYDCLIIPSGPQWRKFNKNSEVLQFVKNLHSAGTLIASFCTGNLTVQAAGLVDFPRGPELFPDKVTLVKEGILFGPRGGGPPPGDGFESIPYKEICDAIYREIISKKIRNLKYELKGPYLGRKPPGLTPEIFAPGIICTEISEGCSGWGNDMEFFIFQQWINRKSILYIMNRVNDIWSDPEILPFSDEYQVGDFTVGPDGKTLIFASRILIEEFGAEGEGANIWIVEKTKDGWTRPRPIGDPVNTKYHDSYPCLAANRNLYFFSRKPGGFGKSDIYMSQYVDGKYQEPVNFGSRLNTEYHEWDTYIAPDESYMIYCSMMPGGLGEDDFYITFKNSDGIWSEPIHMGNEINSDKSENRPYVSPDGKYFFYTSSKRGNRDIYWVDAEIIEKLRPK